MAETKNIITVKNAEGDPDTTAEIIIQNKIDFEPKVSVIIPVYNVEEYLRECLDSVINQTLKEIEIICVDDGSTDSSLEILKEYAKKDNRITVASQKNLHAGVARNAGLAVAKGKYLSFLDSDDFFELNMLEESYKKAQIDHSDIVMFDTYLFDDTLRQDKEVDWTLDVKNVPSNFSYKDIPDRIFKLSNCWVWNRLYNHKFVKEKELYFQNIAFSNDVYFSCIATIMASNISIFKKKLVHYRTNRSTKDNVTSDFYRLQNPTESLKCFCSISKKLHELNLFHTIKSSFLIICTENLFWSFQCMKKNIKSQNEFEKYFSNNYKNIFSKDAPFFNNILNKKYNILRNILIDNNVINEIPKRIFYVWGANEPKRDEVKKCISSWEKFLPDYDIVEINDESTEYFNFQEELKNNKWFRTVYDRKMWAYVADYIRIKTLYEHGGIYFDTDVSVVRNMDKFLNEPAFVGMQRSSIDGNGDWVEPAVLGSKKNNPFIKKILSFYDNLIWEKEIYTMPHLFNYYLSEYDIFPFPERKKQEIIKLNHITIYPERYFIPYRFREEYSDSCITPDTHTIHWWGSSWTKPEVFKFLNSKHRLYSLTDQEPVFTYKNNALQNEQHQLIKDENNYISIPTDKPISLSIRGRNNTITIDPNVSSKHHISIAITGNNNYVKIGKSNCEIELHIGSNSFDRYTNNASFILGNGNSSHSLPCFIEEDNSSILIGDNNLFSWDVELRCSDSHTILDENNNPINFADSIQIGNNNWICKEVTFLKNSKINDNNVCGYRSVISKKFNDSNVLLAGIPAKIVKKNISWDGKRIDRFNMPKMSPQQSFNTPQSQNIQNKTSNIKKTKKISVKKIIKAYLFFPIYLFKINKLRKKLKHM